MVKEIIVNVGSQGGNEVADMLREYEGKRVRLIIDVLPDDIQPVTFSPNDPQPPHICEENKVMIDVGLGFGAKKETALYKYKGGVYTTARYINPINPENASYNVYASYGKSMIGRIVEDAGLGFRVGNGDRHEARIDERIEAMVEAQGLRPHFEEDLVKYDGGYYVIEHIIGDTAILLRNGLSVEVPTSKLQSSRLF
jgi:hypothetical protein